MLETPWTVKPIREENGVKVEFRNLMELCQGCPEVGQLFVNGRAILPKERFGGPILLVDRVLYAPLYKKTFFKAGFTIARIQFESGEVFASKAIYPLIHLFEFKEGVLRFFSDMERSKIVEVPAP